MFQMKRRTNAWDLGAITQHLYDKSYKSMGLKCYYPGLLIMRGVLFSQKNRIRLPPSGARMRIVCGKPYTIAAAAGPVAEFIMLN